MRPDAEDCWCGYGHFGGGDPRLFHPDEECCTAEELAAHADACKRWDEMEAQGVAVLPDPAGHGAIVDAQGRQVGFWHGGAYGIGTYTCDGCAAERKAAKP